MTASPGAIRPIFASEQLLAGFGGQPPFLFCGGSAFVTLAALATLNEALTAKNGWPMNKAQLIDLLKTGWRAFTRVADSNGIPDRDDGLRIWRAMFPELARAGCEPTPVATRDRKLVREHLDSGLALSTAFRLRALPARSRWRQYTSADHQATMWDRESSTVRRQDPMHGHSTAYLGERLSLDEGLDAAEAIENGLILYWTAPVGGWTAEKLAVREVRGELRAARTENENKTRRIADLRAELEACQGGTPTDCGPLVENARNAGWTGGLEAIKRDADRHIEEGP